MDRLVIFGSRSFTDADLLASTMAKRSTPRLIITGGADGADSLGRAWALEHKVQVADVPAMWKQFGRVAGFRRNYDMASLATDALCFWDGESRGTLDMITQIKTAHVPLQIVRYENDQQF
jgi:hypothetical protein